nr:hypothetical protein [Cupriavidus sp. D39]
MRAQLLPEVTPTFSGYVAWRGLVPELELSEQAVRMLRNTFAFQQGVGHLMLEYLVPGANGSTTEGERRWNWVWYRKVAAGANLPR